MSPWEARYCTACVTACLASRQVNKLATNLGKPGKSGGVGGDVEGAGDVDGEDDAELHGVSQVCVGGPHLPARARPGTETHLRDTQSYC